MIKILFLLFLPILSLFFWLLNFVVLQKQFSIELLNTYLGQIFGVLGFSFIVVNFLLATRLKFIEKVFRGYDKVYKYHLYTGRIVGAMILLHPTVLMLRAVFDIDSLFRAISIYFIPNLQNLVFATGIIGFWGINFLIFLTIAVKLPYHIWKHSHRFMIVFFLIISWHVLLQLPFQSLPYSMWLVTLGCVGVLSFFYREVVYEYFLYSKFHVKSVENIGDVTEFVLDDKSKDFKFLPGQFGVLSIRNNSKITYELHPYTFSSAPSQNLRISAKNLGDFSAKLKGLKVGDEVRVWGPHGMFGQTSKSTFFFPNNKKTVMIAGGIGITPFLSILNEFSLNQERYAENSEVYLISSCKVPQENIYNDEIEKFSKSISFLQYIKHCSDHEGYINLEYLTKILGSDLSEYNFMICGPSVMMKSIHKILMGKSVPQDQIFFEDFSFK